MKRIESACICQTLLFSLKENLSYEETLKQTSYEVNHYKAVLDRNRTKYKILEENIQEDGSIIVKVIKQYNMSPVGGYLA